MSITRIPTYNYIDSQKYKYLEKLDNSPEYPTMEDYSIANRYILRRDRMHHKTTTKDKIQAGVGSFIGLAIPMAMMMKKQGVKNPFKIKYGLGDMLVLSATPIVTGVTVGMIGNDAQTNYSKSREGVFQFFNAAIPTWLCGAVLTLCETNKKMNNNLSKILSIIGALLVGMHGAAAVSNYICDPEDNHPDRKLTLKDSLANMDDMIGVLVLAKFPFVEKLHLDKLLPIIYGYCGYRAGKSN